MWNSKVFTSSLLWVSSWTHTTHQSSTRSVQLTHKWAVHHGWIHSNQCWNYPTNHKSSIISTVESTINKNYDQYHKLRTISIPVLHIKYSSHNKTMLQLHTHLRIKLVERICLDFRQKFNKMTTLKDTLTWFTNHKLWVSNNL